MPLPMPSTEAKRAALPLNQNNVHLFMEQFSLRVDESLSSYFVGLL